ncbi:MAG TPA: hypothetical protein VG708_05455 [Mycobacteriales bacterium]|nr:hypothetical protein [Mycobacteriales bacterium]
MTVAIMIGTMLLTVADIAIAITQSQTHGCASDAFVATPWYDASRRTNLVLMDCHLHITRVLTHDGRSLDPAFSPDGRQIAFADGRDRPSSSTEFQTEPTSIYLINTDGTGLRRLTRGNDRSPTWSSDGRHLTFVREHSHKAELRIVDVATGRETAADRTGQPSPLGQGGSAAVWNPSHTAFAVATRRGPVRVVRLPSGKPHDVPGTALASQAIPWLWTTDDNLIIEGHFKGGFTFVVSHHGTATPTRLGQVASYNGPKADNPTHWP